MKKTIIAALALAAFILVPFRAHSANPLEALGSVVGSLTSTDKFELSSITGTWDYKSPAVSFKSDQALSKIGGAAASSTIESKLQPYYHTLGIDKMSVEIAEQADSTYSFAIKLGKLPLKGTVTKDSDNGQLTFHVGAVGKLKALSLSAKAEKNATGELTLTFDATKFMQMVAKVASVSGNYTLKSVDKLLSTYDGLYVGAKMARQGGSASGAAGAIGNLLDGLKK